MGEKHRKGGDGAASEAGRSPAVGAAGTDRGRWSTRRKAEIVLRVLRGEDLDALSRELGVTAARIAEWRDQFLAAGQAGLKTRQPDVRDDENLRLRAKVGELMMDKELLEARIEMIEGRDRPRSGRSRP